MIVLGLSAYYHDAACAVMIDGELVAAAQEERFTRRRFDPALPVRAVRACLRDRGLSIADVDHVAYYEDPEQKLGRQLWMSGSPLPPAGPETLFRLDADRPWRQIEELLGYTGEVSHVSHHEAHAASAFYQSGFTEAALCTADAVGEWATTSYGTGGPDGVALFEQVDFPHSLGILYSALTSFLGFAVNSDEYKVMGLAPYGTPRFLDRMRELVVDGPGGAYRLAQRFFRLDGTAPMYTGELAELLGLSPRDPESEIKDTHCDVAASAQVLLEEVLLAKLAYLHERTGRDRLCFAGGVALNCVANRRIREDGPYADVFVQPAAGDAGAAIGAAAAAGHRLTGRYRRERLRHVSLGPEPDVAGVRDWLRAADVPHCDFAGREEDLAAWAARELEGGAVLGWFQGRMEFGPRALGNRSILADPRRDDMRDHINALVKKREAFRPFAPAVAAERCAEFFELTVPSPFMLDVARVREPAALPAITHVDESARVQTVDAATAPRFHALLTAFGARTGYPILLNTSFNMRGEPIVATAQDALACFVRSRLDVLVLDGVTVRAADVPEHWFALVEGQLPYRQPPISRDVYSFL